MNQVIVGMFASYRDGHDALRVLQAMGLKRDDAQIYSTAMPTVEYDALAPPAHDEDVAEYIAHGEHQGVIGARNRFSADDSGAWRVSRCKRERTLLVVRTGDDIKSGVIGDMLHEHGAVAVKDATGHWRFSPFRNPARV